MRLRTTLKQSFITGIILLAPLLVTVIAIQFVLGWIRGFLGPVIEGTRYVDYVGDVEIAAELLAIVLVVLAIALAGYLAQRRIGRWLFRGLDRGIGLIPLVRVVYSSVQQVSNAMTSQRTRFESVVLVEYPRREMYALGFITAESPSTVTSAIGEDAVNVYVPNSPNPTGGKLLMVPESQIAELDMSVSRGIRLLVTTGIAENDAELAELREEVQDERAFEFDDLV